MYIFQYQRLQQRLTLPQPLKPLQLLKVPQLLRSPNLPLKNKRLLQSLMHSVLCRENHFCFRNFPIDPQRRIIELNPTLILRSIIIVTFILKNRLWTQHSEPMCKSFRNKKLSFILTRQDYGPMFSQSSPIFT